MTFEQQWIEYDYNPFIVFNANAKVLSLNSEAQYLLGNVTPHTVFELAMNYASPSFGFKTTFLDLEYGRFKFFGITVGYENEEEIGIRLYQTPGFKFNKPKVQGELVNVYTLIDLCISSNSISAPYTFTKILDPSIPEVRLNADRFIKLLNKIYKSAKSTEEVITRLYIRVGEYIKYEGKKYSLFSVEISGENIDHKKHSEIESQLEEMSLFGEVSSNKITINIPLISE